MLTCRGSFWLDPNGSVEAWFCSFSCAVIDSTGCLCCLCTCLHASYSLPISLLLDPLMSSRKEIIYSKIVFLLYCAATQVQWQMDYSSNLSSSMFKSLHTGPILDLSYMWWRTTTCPRVTADRQLTAASLFVLTRVTSLMLHWAAWLKRTTVCKKKKKNLHRQLKQWLWVCDWAKLWNVVNSVHSTWAACPKACDCTENASGRQT